MLILNFGINKKLMSLSFRFYTFNNYYDFFSLKWEEKKKKKLMNYLEYHGNHLPFSNLKWGRFKQLFLKTIAVHNWC